MTPRRPRRPSTPAPPPARWGFAVDLSGGAATLLGGGASAHAVAGVALTATSKEAGRLRLDLFAGWPARHRSEALADGASASQDSWPIRAALVFSGARPGARRPVAWQAGIDALVTVDRASSSGVVQPGTNRRLTLARPGGNDWSLTALLTFQPREAQSLLATPSGDAGTLRVAPEHLAWFPATVRDRHPAPTDGGAVAMPEARPLGPLPFAAISKSPLLHGAALVFPSEGLVYLVLYTM